MKHFLLLLLFFLASCSCSEKQEEIQEQQPVAVSQPYTPSYDRYAPQTPESTLDSINKEPQEGAMADPDIDTQKDAPKTATPASTSFDRFKNRSKAWLEGYDQGYNDGYEDSDNNDYGESYNSRCRYKGKKRKVCSDGERKLLKNGRLCSVSQASLAKAKG